VRRQATIGALLLIGICAAGPLALAGSHRSTGTLTFEGELTVKYPPVTCPAGTAGSVECFARTGSATIRGLGNVKATYPYFVESNSAGCATDEVRVLPTTVRLNVAGKGEIELRGAGSGCLRRVPPEPVRGEERFTITGGSGTYAGASGGGQIAHVSNGPPNWSGRDTWTGTLAVQGLNFDLTAPVLKGAVAKAVRAQKGKKSARVVYRVTASDNLDGAVPVSCLPRSGSSFRVGRTTVRCTATDKSGNTVTAKFTVTVRR
jgi:HYR domain-containing protein